MYDKNATNYGLDRGQFIRQQNLTADEKNLLTKIQPYLMDTGYYNDRAIRRDTGGDSSIEASFFSDVTDSDSDMLKLAMKLNDAWDLVVEAAEISGSNDEVDAIMQRLENQTASNSDMSRLVDLGLAVRVYGNGNRATGIQMIERGDVYADQVGIEENPPLR